MNYTYQERIAKAIKRAFEEDNIMIRETDSEFQFSFKEIIDIEFWQGRWKTHKSVNYLQFDELVINHRSIHVPKHLSEEIAAYSNEYAVMQKLGQ